MGAVKATGDQLAVADHIYPKQTDTAIIFVCSPVRKIIDLEIEGIKDASSSTVQAIRSALTDLFLKNQIPMGPGKFTSRTSTKVLRT